jgi:hypothetical protein
MQEAVEHSVSGVLERHVVERKRRQQLTESGSSELDKLDIEFEIYLKLDAKNSCPRLYLGDRMGNCLQLHRDKKELKKTRTQVELLREAQTSMLEFAQQCKEEKERSDKEINCIGKQIALQLKLYKQHKCSRETAERVLKELKLKERLAIAELEKRLKNELAWRQRANQFADTELSVQNSQKLGKLVVALSKVDIKVDKLEDVMVRMDDQIADMNDATSRVQDINDNETARGVENTGEFEREAGLSVNEMLDKADAQELDLDALPKPRTRAPLHTHRILGPNALRSDEEEEEEDGAGGGFVNEDLNAGEDHTVFSNMD